jgi:hypothetical protein
MRISASDSLNSFIITRVLGFVKGAPGRAYIRITLESSTTLDNYRIRAILYLGESRLSPQAEASEVLPRSHQKTKQRTK